MSAGPRWEWRTFDGRFESVERRLHEMASELRDSAETYVLSDLTDANVKIRDSLLDIKLLRKVGMHGLELWEPVLKAAFPLTRDAMAVALGAWGLPPARAADRQWPLAAFLDEFVARERALVRIAVAKRRRVFDVDGCLVELADLVVDGKPVRTAAVEMSDPARVWRTVEALDLSELKNVNYVNALKRLAAMHCTTSC